ncbi:MAG: LON peptidase substrate-binding domain-containing protein [Chitinophagaceae bacterium]|jgi:Lon protease-like protein|nr:LON peptidase substrate-binding domain-containing protein [Chitinophagaceae bacterium]MCA6467557.1 LON peptidase substrate-binding domain-containing protein [Chitinophagaceae bacterium]MCA6469249.1 LON peptidase substrate-binding domain-containing protein [Chitinophagaceae bacterium]MCA6472284.1 LON peptidase substrate-binding domain-containing protein [Chitinophagaceae bacterium]MCA6475603.1 LON peptidase substrate-binding domain-containing protein [Chitinophagaceae bacterium]
MTNFIPLFPLGIVVYPREWLNLHIFEPRYRQLIRECKEENKAFGIPPVIANRVQETGSIVEIKEVVTEYDDGRMDIRVQGIRIFRMLEVVKTIPDKLYSGAIVHYPDNRMTSNSVLLTGVLAAIRELHRRLNVTKKFRLPDEQLCSYDLAHHAGLSLEQEYELLELVDEWQRLEYLRRHLQSALPMIAEMDSLRERINLNGHFRELKGWDPE